MGSIGLGDEEVRAALAATSDFVALAEADGTFVLVNHGLAELDERELLGTKLVQHVEDADVPRLQRALHDVVEFGEPVDVDVYLRMADDTRRCLKVQVTRLDRHGASPRVLYLVIDVTERRRAETALADAQALLMRAQKLEAVGRFAGSIAHDFNNVLTAIRYHTAFALEDLPRDSPVARELEDVDEAAKRGADLTRQLLAFGRRQVMVPRIVDVNEVVHETCAMLRRLVGERIELTTELHSGIAKVKADKGQLGQVLTNLIVNARDAIEGDGTIWIRTEVDAEREWVFLSVEDTGTGMSSGVQAQIFEPFFTTKPDNRGTGLGLATVYGIVRQSGGDIHVESEPDQGTIFRVGFPWADGPVWQSPRPSERPRYRWRATRVLLVENDDELRRSASRVLCKAGYDVLEASDGEQALEIREREDAVIDLVVSDVIMPRMTGPELARRLQDEHPELAILLMSGYTESPILDQVPWPVLPKPFSPQELVARVREVLDERGAYRSP